MFSIFFDCTVENGNFCVGTTTNDSTHEEIDKIPELPTSVGYDFKSYFRSITLDFLIRGSNFKVGIIKFTLEVSILYK